MVIDMPNFKIISLIIILLTTLLAGIYPFIKKIRTTKGFESPNGEALATGVFLGAGLIHMLADACAGLNHTHYGYPLAFLLAGSIYLLLLLLEHVARELYGDSSHAQTSFALLALVMLSIHSFLAGAALGLSHNWSVFVMIFLAIIAHKWAASFALAVQLNKSQLSLKTSLGLFMIFASMVPLGILFGHIVHHDFTNYPLLEPIFTALAAGTFLYLGTLHGLKKAVMIEHCCNLKRFSYVIMGFGLMAIVAVWT